MPRSRDEIYDEIVKKIEEAVSSMESYGCSSGTPRVQDYLFEARALLWDALTDEERNWFEQMFRELGYAAHEARLMCQNLGAIRKDIERYREWKIEELMKRLGRR